MSPKFLGFPKDTMRFLLGIRKNNSKKWFDAHRAEYESSFVAPAKAFVEFIGPKLTKLSPGLVAEPRINGSIFRINKDIRFSKDKRPYKDHLDMIFWEGEKKSSPSSLFFRISPDGLFIGTGFHKSCPEHLKAFRSALAHEESAKDLARAAARIRKAGLQIQGEHYKRIPRGFSDEGPAAEFLLHNALYVVTEQDADAAFVPGIIDLCLKQWKSTMPLHNWLINNLR